MAGHEVLEQRTGDREDADDIKADTTDMDGYGGVVEFGPGETKWICSRVEAARRVLICHH
jgi:hypothetical protein